jgi:CheY-like chemotaxis protein
MDKKILFVRDSKSFLVTAMIKSLENERYVVVTADPDIVEISLIKNLPQIFIVYLEGDLNKFNGTLKYLKKIITEDSSDHILYLIGNPMEIAAAYEVVPKSLVSAAFTRPVNMKEITSKLNTLLLDDGLSSGTKRILVVDDDGTMLRAMKNWLSEKYEVFMANSGMNAIAFLAQKKVDLILLDYEMPVADGLQVFQMLKSEPSTANIPVIFLTAKDDKETVMKVLAAKPEKYLLKTLPPEELLKSVDNFFKGK